MALKSWRMSSSLQMENKPRRFERKFRVEHLSPEAVSQAVKMLPWGFRPLFPDRRINNIYFDTPAMDFYHQNGAGDIHRKKYRLRWYGEDHWPQAGAYFEVKERNHELGDKSSYLLQAAAPGNFKGLLEQLRAIPEIPGFLQPILANTYIRSYFGTPSGAFRITIDRDQRFEGIFHQHLGKPLAGFTFPTPDPACILELKYKDSLDEAIDPIVQNLPFRLQKNSKYVQGVDLLYRR